MKLFMYTVDTRYLDIGYLDNPDTINIDVFVRSRILSLYILYIFIKSTFVSQYFAYLDMFLGPKQCFHMLI